ncbi:MAG: hypothetical protein KBT03_13385, partial [Bacteroidales bacterium]|nr:hypothetical protein [Candidatus Scybalousia scybalohippi]
MDKIYHKTTWQNSPSTNTPINETNLNNIENGVDAIDSRVVDLGNTKSSVDWVQLQQSGDKIAEITIDGVKKAVYSKQASGSVLENALKSEGFAVGTQDGQPVSSGSPYFENNAKYYAEDSAKSSAESKYWSEKSGSSRLVSMDDVNINSPQDKQALVYDALTGKW